jgi:hypothetical protein
MRQGVLPETQKRTALKKKLFLEALAAKAGNISKACDAAGIGRTTFYQWREADPKFVAAFSDVDEAIIDWGEDALKARMQAGDTTAIIFFLKTKGRKRGYQEVYEHAGAFDYRVVFEMPRPEKKRNGKAAR